MRICEIHQATGSPLAEEALCRIGELYRIEAEVRGRPPDERMAARRQRSKPLVEALHAWLTTQLGRVSRHSALAEAIRYAPRHWTGLVLFLEGGQIELDTKSSSEPPGRSPRGARLPRSPARMVGRAAGRSWRAS
jgi:transposase